MGQNAYATVTLKNHVLMFFCKIFVTFPTGVLKIKKIRGRKNISVGTWNVRTLGPAGKLEELTHAIGRYHWNIEGLCFKCFGLIKSKT